MMDHNSESGNVHHSHAYMVSHDTLVGSTDICAQIYLHDQHKSIKGAACLYIIVFHAEVDCRIVFHLVALIAAGIFVLH